MLLNLRNKYPNIENNSSTLKERHMHFLDSVRGKTRATVQQAVAEVSHNNLCANNPIWIAAFQLLYNTVSNIFFGSWCISCSFDQNDGL